MAFCTKCGAQVPDGQSFCTSCGAPMNAAAPQNNAQPPKDAQAAPVPVPQPQPQQQYQQQGQYGQQGQYQQQAQYQQQYRQPAYDYFDHTAEFDPQDISDNKVFAMATYLLGFIGIIIALIASSESKYARFHVRQALKIEVCMALVAFFSIIPFLGWLATGVCELILFVVLIISFFSAAGGKAKEPPIIKGLSFLK